MSFQSGRCPPPPSAASAAPSPVASWGKTSPLPRSWCVGSMGRRSHCRMVFACPPHQTGSAWRGPWRCCSSSGRASARSWASRRRRAEARAWRPSGSGWRRRPWARGRRYAVPWVPPPPASSSHRTPQSSGARGELGACSGSRAGHGRRRSRLRGAKGHQCRGVGQERPARRERPPAASPAPSRTMTLAGLATMMASIPGRRSTAGRSWPRWATATWVKSSSWAAARRAERARWRRLP
mmetsp:Transcript_49553/g.143796  ORF Transcript_49553/g.143796 Transcript_49553/m.143796 type:complete len:238 (+) Transcript_49553:1-714(+)